jgi:uncharacterized protein
MRGQLIFGCLVFAVWGCGAPLGPTSMTDVPASTAQLERGCEAGTIDACTRAAELFRDGTNGHPYDPAKSFRYAQRACLAGDGVGCTVLAWHYENGIDTAWSPQRAVLAYSRSCQAGVALACASLGTMFSTA